MSTKTKKKLFWGLSTLAGLGISIVLGLNSFGDKFFSSISDYNSRVERTKTEKLIEVQREKDYLTERQKFIPETNLDVPNGKIKSIPLPDFTKRVNFFPKREIYREIVISPTFGADTSKLVNQILNSNSGNVRINFPSGKYTFRSKINLRSGVVLRGEGIRKTIFVLDSPESAFRFSGVEGESTLIQKGYALGSSVLAIKDPSKFSKEDMVYIHSLKGRKNYQESDGSRLGPSAPFDEIRFVFGLTGNELQLNFPLNYIYPQETLPQLKKIIPIQSGGLEDLTLETSPREDGFPSVVFQNAFNCWVQNCELSHSRHSHVEIIRSSNITIANSYLHHGWGYGTSIDSKVKLKNPNQIPILYGYGIILSEGSSDCLIQNNVFNNLRHAMVTKMGANHNIFGYNYSINHNPQQQDVPSADGCDHGGGYSNLFEGNEMCFLHSADYWHPAGPLQTAFRNKFTHEGFFGSLSSHFPIILGNEIPSVGRYNLGGIYLGNIIGAVVGQNLVASPEEKRKRFSYEGDNCVFTPNQEELNHVVLPTSLYRKDISKPYFGPNASGEELPAKTRYKKYFSSFSNQAVED